MLCENSEFEHMVLLFGKALRCNIVPVVNKSNPDELWIALGYFDSLEVYSLKERCKNCSKWIKQLYIDDVETTRKLSEDSYYHSIHILSDIPDETTKKRYQAFFEKRSPYFVVTLLQGRLDDINIELLKLHEQIETFVTNMLTVAPLQCADDLSWVIYKTLELSDLVILWKSKSLNDILNLIERLHSSPCVGDLHSIPCIYMKVIKEWEKEETQALFIQEKIKQLSIGYLVSDMQEAVSFFSNMPKWIVEEPLITTGVEDFRSTLTDLDTKLLLNTLYYRLFGDGAVHYRKAFIASDMHLSVKYDKLAYSTPRFSKLAQCCKDLQTQFKSTSEVWIQFFRKKDINSDWLMTARKLYNSLYDMSQNAVEDRFCFLVLDSVRMFCLKIRYRLGKMDSDTMYLIHKFLQGWSTLMEHAPKVDGKFLQQPGISHMIYHIPSLLLEIYLAFTYLCGLVMQIGSNDNTHFAIMLVPKLCRRIKVDIVFQDEPPCDRLLNVDIPLHMLYEPFDVLCQLCHEISHFCGDIWRKRDTRVKNFLHVVSTELALELELVHDEVMGRIFNDLCSMVMSSDARYLDNLYDMALDAVYDLLNDEETIISWINIGFSSGSSLFIYSNQAVVISRCQGLKADYTRNSGHGYSGLFFANMEDYYYLFNECYADISVVFMLHLQAEEYIKMFERELLISQVSDKKDVEYYRNVERCALVLKTVYNEGLNKELENVAKNETSTELHEFVNDIVDCINFLFNPQGISADKAREMGKYYNARESVRYIKDYLGKCYKGMTEGEREDRNVLGAKLSEFRQIFEKLGRRQTLLDPSIFKMLSEFRNYTLNQ